MTIEDDLYSVVRQSRPLHRDVHRVVEAQLAGSGITVAMRAVLEELAGRGPRTVPELARTLALDRQPVQRSVDAALGQGLVARRENPRHRSSPVMALTDRGADGFAAIRDHERAVLLEIAEGISPADAEAARRVVTRLAEEFAALAATGRRSSEGERS